ncbi:MAG: hypothetical protein LBS50_07850 [Prevotellaceae bacterium]|jgi:pimeloyl-ACP methyl ester carboxylesterase|nr:hypothetical protein [Prevotellaceae bacterium]
MKRKILFLCLCVNIFFANAQVIDGLNARLFQIKHKSDTIYFIKTDTCTTKAKPTIIFIQGSQPIPLISDFGDNFKHINAFNFDYEGLSKEYNFVIISMPNIPPIVESYRMNNQGAFLPDTACQTCYDSLYRQYNYLDKYVERAEIVLKFLQKQKWVDKNKIAVFGHSQGSYIAVKLAEKNPIISAVGYSSGNPAGRFASYFYEININLMQQQITPQDAQNQADGLIEYFIQTNKGIDLYPEYKNADLPKTTTSFSFPFWQNLIQLKTPIYITYGTLNYESALPCQLLPVYFELYGKTNYKINSFVGCGHNFEEFDENGTPNYEKTQWNEAITDFIEWWKNLEN